MIKEYGIGHAIQLILYEPRISEDNGVKYTELCQLCGFHDIRSNKMNNN